MRFGSLIQLTTHNAPLIRSLSISDVKRLDNVIHVHRMWLLLLCVRQRIFSRCRQRRNSPRGACSCCVCLHKLVVSPINRSGLVIEKGGCAEMAAELSENDSCRL